MTAFIAKMLAIICISFFSNFLAIYNPKNENSKSFTIPKKAALEDLAKKELSIVKITKRTNNKRLSLMSLRSRLGGRSNLKNEIATSLTFLAMTEIEIFGSS